MGETPVEVSRIAESHLMRDFLDAQAGLQKQTGGG
jgi:hypothetical protein